MGQLQAESPWRPTQVPVQRLGIVGTGVLGAALVPPHDLLPCAAEALQRAADGCCVPGTVAEALHLDADRSCGRRWAGGLGAHARLFSCSYDGSIRRLDPTTGVFDPILLR